MSVDRLNRSRAGLLVTCPLTRSASPRLIHVAIEPPEANLTSPSFVLVEQVRSISVDRLGPRMGRVSAATSAAIDDQLRRLFGLRAPR